MLKSPKLMKWFCTNLPDINNDKIIALPMGFQERERLGGNQKILTGFLESKTKVSEKKERTLLPYHDFDTNLQRNRLFGF